VVHESCDVALTTLSAVSQPWIKIP
jgi:hypothetical protein